MSDPTPHLSAARGTKVSGQPFAFDEFSGDWFPVDAAGAAVRSSEADDMPLSLQRAKEALKESEEKFRKAFNATPDAITVTDLETARYLDINDGFLNTFGFERSEVVGRRSSDIGIWADPNDRVRLVEQLKSRGCVRDLHAVARCKGGMLRTLSIAGELVEVAGREVLILICRDISEQLRLERAMRETVEKLSKVFHLSPDAMALTELESGTFLDVNEAFGRIYGYTKAEVVGRTSFEVGVWATPEGRSEYIGKVRQGVVRDFESLGRRADGALIHTLISGDMFEYGGQSLLITVVRDITRQKRAEADRAVLEAQLRRAQRLESLGTMAGGIAHDFNNILTAIMAYTDFAVLDADRPEEVQRHLCEVRKASERARDLVGRILTFSRQQKQERKPVDVKLVVREVLGLVRSTMPATIRIEEMLVAGAVVVHADPGQLHQVFMNLATNAEHAMRGRQGTLGVSMETGNMFRGKGQGSSVCITFSDTGHGMGEDTVKRIFEPFFTTKPPGEGTGLGLSVVHGIIQDHDGSIEVHSVPGRGSAFRVVLPLHAERPAEISLQGSSLPMGAGQRILFLDDEQPICEVGHKLLTRLGYKVVTCTNPVEALASLSGSVSEFDLIVTDLTMPNLTGIDLAKRVLARRPGMPVILMTGFSGAWTPERVKELGVRELLSKPLDLLSLSAAVSRALASVSVSPR